MKTIKEAIAAKMTAIGEYGYDCGRAGIFFAHRGNVVRARKAYARIDPAEDCRTREKEIETYAELCAD